MTRLVVATADPGTCRTRPPGTWPPASPAQAARTRKTAITRQRTRDGFFHAVVDAAGRGVTRSEDRQLCGETGRYVGGSELSWPARLVN